MKYLDQQTGCVAQVSWSKYTTPNLQVIMIHSYISTLSCNQMVSTTKFKVRKFYFARMDFSFLKNKTMPMERKKNTPKWYMKYTHIVSESLKMYTLLFYFFFLSFSHLIHLPSTNLISSCEALLFVSVGTYMNFK